MKQIWQELPKHMDTPVAPLDEEMLVDLAKEPAGIEGYLTSTGWPWWFDVRALFTTNRAGAPACPKEMYVLNISHHIPATCYTC